MATAKYYSPRVDRDLITPPYHGAKSRRVPMTRFASALIRDGLKRLDAGAMQASAVVREEPPTPDPPGRQP